MAGKKNTSFQCADLTRKQIEFCKSRTGLSQSQIITIAIDRFSKDLIRELEFLENPETIEVVLKGIRKTDTPITISEERRNQIKRGIE